MKDVAATARHAQAAGCEIKWDANHNIPGVDRFFIYDPDGNRVEIQGSDGGAP